MSWTILKLNDAPDHMKLDMPAERLSVGGLTSTGSPVKKKRKLSGSPLLLTPTLVLEQVKNVSVSKPIRTSPPLPLGAILSTAACSLAVVVIPCDLPLTQVEEKLKAKDQW